MVGSSAHYSRLGSGSCLCHGHRDRLLRDEELALTRLEALKTARQHVAELYSLKNDRGYPRFTGSTADVLNQELAIAQWLLKEPQAVDDDED